MLQLALLLWFAGVPVPLPSEDIYLPLFVIERSTNANVVHYPTYVRNGKYFLYTQDSFFRLHEVLESKLMEELLTLNASQKR
jgi:hypothetical protein